MKRYIALLRGINVGGKNKIAMSELKLGFTELGYTEVSTHLNSGNVIFSSDVDDVAVLSGAINQMIKNKYPFDIPVFVISQKELEDILNHAPDWWGNSDKEIYDNLIFMIPPMSYEVFFHGVGQPKEGYEKVHHDNNAIFWSFHRKDYQKTNWWSKTASSAVGSKVTIRTANTVRKIVGM